LREGSTQVVENCLSIEPSDHVVIVTDMPTMDIAVSLMEKTKEITENVSFHILEDYQKRPIEKIPTEIVEALESATVSIFAVQSMEGELQSLRKPFLDIVAKKKIRHAHMVGVTPTIMAQGMAANYKQVQEFSKRVHDIVKNVKEARVTTVSGTDLKIKFSKKTPWIISDGIITKESWSNLPDGEVWTIAKNVEGKVVVDGVLGDHFSQKYGLLYDNPLLMEVIDGRIKYLRCDNPKLKKEFEEYLQTDENANRIGEVAFGTNLALKELIGNMLQDEKIPGFHFAVGHTYPDRTGVDWDSTVHCDAVIQRPTIVIDGKLLMKDGAYLI